MRQKQRLKVNLASRNPRQGQQSWQLPMTSGSGTILCYISLPLISEFDLGFCLFILFLLNYTDSRSSDLTARRSFPLLYPLNPVFSAPVYSPYLKKLAESYIFLGNTPVLRISPPFSPNKTPQSERFLTSPQFPHWNLNILLLLLHDLQQIT